MHRDYLRDGRSDNISGPYEEGRVRKGNVSLAKHLNKKASTYWIFVQKEGRKAFLNRTGKNYDQDNREHKAIMTEIYKNCERIDEYAAQAAAKNADRPLQTRMWHKREYDKRNAMFAMGRDYSVMKKEHRRLVNDTHVPNENATIPLRASPPIHYTESQKKYLDERKQFAATALKAYLGCRREELGNPLISEYYTIQLLSVFPTIYTYRLSMGAMACYPAEIGVTTFHLKTGVIESNSIFVMFDKMWFGDEEAEFEIKKKYTKLLGVDINGPTADLPNALSPNKAFLWLNQQLEKNPAKRLLVDENQLNFVYYGIQTLAYNTGVHAVKYFQLMIHPHIVSIQDYTKILIDLAPSRLSPNMKWSNKKIETEYLNYHLVPSRDHAHFCEGHDGMLAPHKYYCVKAHNARLLHHFYHIIKNNKLEDISEHISGSHCPCIEDWNDKLLPPTLKAATLSYEQAGNARYAAADSTDGNNEERFESRFPDEDQNAPLFGYSNGDHSGNSRFSNSNPFEHSYRSDGYRQSDGFREPSVFRQSNGDYHVGPSSSHDHLIDPRQEMEDEYSSDEESSDDDGGYLRGAGTNEAVSMTFGQPDIQRSVGPENRELVQRNSTFQPESVNQNQHLGLNDLFISSVNYVIQEPGINARDVEVAVPAPRPVALPSSGQDSYAREAARSGGYKPFVILLDDKSSWATPFVECTHPFHVGEYYTKHHRYHWDNPENQKKYIHIRLP